MDEILLCRGSAILAPCKSDSRETRVQTLHQALVQDSYALSLGERGTDQTQPAGVSTTLDISTSDLIKLNFLPSEGDLEKYTQKVFRSLLSFTAMQYLKLKAPPGLKSLYRI